MNSIIGLVKSGRRAKVHWNVWAIIQIAKGAGVYILFYVEVSNYIDIFRWKPGPIHCLCTWSGAVRME